jgi:hypothetical protein
MLRVFGVRHIRAILTVMAFVGHVGFGQTSTPERPRPYPLLETSAFARAVAQGTRTRSGRPGPRYWQQWARYQLAAELDPRTARIMGHGTIWYYNHSPDTLRHVVFHLYQNVYKPGAVRSVPLPVTTGMRLITVTAQGRRIWPVVPSDSGSPALLVDGTILTLRLPAPLAPGDSAAFAFRWEFTLPGPGDFRIGTDGEVFYVGYWYPQLAVYDDLGGWQADPYLGWGEFYMGYADYDVRLTVPDGFLVAATGTLENAADVLRDEIRRRLSAARRSPEVTHVVGASERGAGRATQRGRRGTLTWRFHAAHVRDFAWGTSDRYLWDATRALVPRATGGAEPDTVMINSFFRPEARYWRHACRYGQHVIEFLARFLWSYPYPQATSVEGLLSGGEEYPMITLIGSGRDTVDVLEEHAHELGHMWFPMLVGSNENHFAWMDEGLTEFNGNQTAAALLSGIDENGPDRDRYIAAARADSEMPAMLHLDQYPPHIKAGAVASYAKIATMLVALRRMLGDSVFMAAYREYGRRWQYKHPQPDDLWNTFHDVTGRDLAWFWRSVLYETWALDQAIGDVRAAGDSVDIVVEDRGLLPMPVDLAITRAQASVERIEVPVDVWLAGNRRCLVRVVATPQITHIEIDPDRAFPDIDRSNQRWDDGPVVSRAPSIDRSAPRCDSVAASFPSLRGNSGSTRSDP